MTSLSERMSAPTRKALDRHIELALRQRFGSRGSLRTAVLDAVLELAAGGASRDDIRSFLTRAVQQHPRRYQWDRVSIVTGLQTSDVLTDRMLAWAGEEADVEPLSSAFTAAARNVPARQISGPSAQAGSVRAAKVSGTRWLRDGDA